MRSVAKYLCAAVLLMGPFSPAQADSLEDFQFAKVLLDEGEWAAAMNFFGLAISGRGLSKKQTAVAYHLRGISRGKLNKHRLALRDHKKAIQLEPDYVSAWSSICYQHGVNTKDLDEALAACNRALELNPNHGPSYALRAKVWQGKGEAKKAEADLARAAQLAPKN